MFRRDGAVVAQPDGLWASATASVHPEPQACACRPAWQDDWNRLRCVERSQDDHLRRGCRCCRHVGSACQPVQGCCRGDRHLAVQLVTPGVRVLRGVVTRMVAVMSRCAVRLEHRVWERPVLWGLPCQASSAEGDPPAPVWPVSAAAAPFGSPAIWAGLSPEEVALDAHLLRLGSDGWERCCEAWLLLRLTVRWVWPAEMQDGWRRGWEQMRQLVGVSAAGGPGIVVPPVSERAASARGPCEPASAPVTPVSEGQRHGVPQASQERRAWPAVAGEMKQHGLGPREPAPVLAAPV